MCVVFAATFAAAQTGSGIAGVVKDETGAVLPGVTSHRLQAVGEYSKQNSDAMVRDLIEAIAIP